MADLIDRQKIKAKFEPWLKVTDYSEGELNMLKAVLYEITVMPSAQPEPSQVARDIATIIENERDMRVIAAQPKAIRPKFVAEDRYFKNHFQTFPHCPKCNYELETGDCYCRVCGCHIDWSEDDE